MPVAIFNMVINAGDQKYYVPIAEDRNALTFSTTRAVKATSYIQESIVNTDQSLLPYEQITTETFYSIPDFFQTSAASVKSDTYVELTFQKSA